MKPQKPMQETLRYKNYVANLRHKPPYAKEAALLKEIAGGVQWRMDAAIEAIVTSSQKKDGYHDIAYINHHNILKQAAMFGRLQTTQKLAAVLEYAGEGKRAASNAVHAAFEVAVTHGHYKVADYLHEKCHARPGYDTGDHTPAAMGWAIELADLKKIAYLVDKGDNPSAALVSAVSNKKTARAVMELLLDKGADINYAARGFWTPFLQAVKYRRFDLAEFLLDKGADPSKSGGEAMLNLMEAGNNKLLQKIIAQGAAPDADLVQRALYAGNIDAAEIMMKSGKVDINAQGGIILLAAVRCKQQPEAVMFCLTQGADPALALATAQRPKQPWERANDDEQIKDYLVRLVQQNPAAKPAAPKPPQP